MTATAPSLAACTPLCRRWLPEGELRVEPLAGAGFSGSPLFIVESLRGRHVLKAFPPDTPPARAQWVQGLMHHLAGEGITTVAPPLATAAGESLVADAQGRLWELLPFISGTPLTEPGDAQIAAALAALARLHAAAASYPACRPDRGLSAGIGRRIQQAAEMLRQPWAALPRGPQAGRSPLAAAVAGRLPTAVKAIEAVEHRRLLAALAAAEARPLPRQAVLRDIWSDHVLFALPGKTRVAGIIDFHAARCDTPATDFARLLGSWLPPAAGAELARWHAALASAAPGLDTSLVCFLAASGVVFGLDNWLRWVLAEGRAFPDDAAALARIDQLLAAAPAALDAMAATLENPGLTAKNCSL